ncbi:hypothetical protein D9757_013763 [Collybiopsis confluens]|uniref:FAD/NAD(P)-binding domain-containing protein n=1 Tax=Collybiopsis confluens TaxID=2823264 RepID=A0A8H5D4H5_9AGAR|nr:hypothetical protein D9757_013763 [Collybiopsis confluens]
MMIRPANAQFTYAGIPIASPLKSYSGQLPRTLQSGRRALETLLRRLVLSQERYPRIEQIAGTIIGITPSPNDRSFIRSVRIRHADRQITELDAAMVVDCTGATRAGAKCLSQAGYGAAETSSFCKLSLGDAKITMDQKLHYTTLTCNISPDTWAKLPTPSDQKPEYLSYMFSEELPERGRRMFTLLRIEANQLVLFAGQCTNEPRKYESLDAMRSFLHSLVPLDPKHPIPNWIFGIIDILEETETPITFSYVRVPPTSYIRYHRTVDLPRNFVAIGDSVMSIDPLFGQGCTKAVLGALALHSALYRNITNGGSGLPLDFSESFFKEHFNKTDRFWQATRLLDYGVPTTEPVPGEDLRSGELVLAVGVMNTNTPPDACNDQVGDCCCNSVAFVLSMLCLNCQKGTGSTGNGYDAGKGAYQMYLEGARTSGTCSPVTNQSLPSEVDRAVCDQGIKIIDDVYTSFWSTGDWYYVWTEEEISRDVAAHGGNAFTHCQSAYGTTTTTSSTSTTSTSTSSTSSSSNSSPTTTDNNNNNNSPSIQTSSTDSTSSKTSGSSSSSGSTSQPQSGSAFATSALDINPSVSTSATSTSTSDSGNSTTAQNSDQNLSSNSPHGLSNGAVGGIAVGTAVTAAIALILLWFFCCIRKKRQSSSVERELGGHSRQPSQFSPFTDASASARNLSDFSSSYPTANPFDPSPQPPLDKLARERYPQNSSSFYTSEDSSSPRPEFGPSEASSTAQLAPVRRGEQPYDSSVIRHYAQSDVSDPASESTPLAHHPPPAMRHTDAGPVYESMLNRRISGSLPPAYGEQISGPAAPPRRLFCRYRSVGYQSEG